MTRRANGTGGITAGGYVHIMAAGVLEYEHIILAERAVGRALPKGVQVHHVDDNRSNNSPTNLVVCPDQMYHRLLHRRARAFDACGNANYLICRHCRKYDDPKNLIVDGSRSQAHRECRGAYRRQMYATKGAA